MSKIAMFCDTSYTYEMYGQIKGKRTKEIHSVQAYGSSPLLLQDALQELNVITPNAAFFTSISVAPKADPDFLFFF